MSVSQIIGRIFGELIELKWWRFTWGEVHRANTLVGIKDPMKQVYGDYHTSLSINALIDIRLFA